MSIRMPQKSKQGFLVCSRSVKLSNECFVGLNSVTLPDEEGESSMEQSRCLTLHGSLKPDAAPPPPLDSRDEASSVNLWQKGRIIREVFSMNYISL